MVLMVMGGPFCGPHAAATRAACALRAPASQAATATRHRGRITKTTHTSSDRPAAPVLHHPARAVGLVFGVRAPLDVEVLFEPAPGLEQPLGARARHRPGLLRAPLVLPPAGVTQPPLTALTGRELRRQLITAPLAERFVFA